MRDLKTEVKERTQKVKEGTQKVKEFLEKTTKIQFLKYFVLFTNVALFCTALVDIYIGFTEWIDFKNAFMGDIFYTVPVSCIIVGCLLLAGFGISAYGVVEEQLIYIGVHCFILGVCATIHMVTVYFVTDYPEMERETQMRIRGTFDQLLEEYDPTTGVETLDILQPMLKCCGVNGHTDWTYERVPQRLVDLGYWANPLFPQSCCEFLSGEPAEQFCVPSTTPTQWMHPIGCFKAFTLHLQEVSALFITYAYWMTGYQIFCFLLSIYLIYEVYSYRKNERDFQIYCSNFVEKSKINSAFLKTCSQESNESQETVVESTGSSERSSQARSA